MWQRYLIVTLVLNDTGELIPVTEDSGISRYFPQVLKADILLDFFLCFL